VTARRRPALFRASDLTRAIKGAQAAGLRVVRSEITEDGRIVLQHEGQAAPASPLDEWRARRASEAQGRSDGPQAAR
jgi:hypothetical protein